VSGCLVGFATQCSIQPPRSSSASRRRENGGRSAEIRSLSLAPGTDRCADTRRLRSLDRGLDPQPVQRPVITKLSRCGRLAVGLLPADACSHTSARRVPSRTSDTWLKQPHRLLSARREERPMTPHRTDELLRTGVGEVEVMRPGRAVVGGLPAAGNRVAVVAEGAREAL
jgi:hypothetical protein